jgi:hypothetical protein
MQVVADGAVQGEYVVEPKWNDGYYVHPIVWGGEELAFDRGDLRGSVKLFERLICGHLKCPKY